MPEPFDPELTPLEASLARLVPRADKLSRERMLFEAGRSSVRPGRLWPALAALSSLAALVLTGFLFMRAPTVVVEGRIVERVKEVPAIPQPSPVPEPGVEPTEEPARGTPPRNEYLRLRERMLLWGVDALPPPEAGTSTDSPLTAADLLAEKPQRGILSLLSEQPGRLEKLP
jgi:hypothetical protein